MFALFLFVLLSPEQYALESCLISRVYFGIFGVVVGERWIQGFSQPV